VDACSPAGSQCNGLDRLFPAGVSCASAQAAASGETLWPGEAAAALRFAPARMAEFRLGRACARRALAALGAPPATIGVGGHREPLWPEGIVGSISHSGGRAAAAVAWSRSFAALGLDIESASGLDPELIAVVCRPEEARRVCSAGASGGLEALRIFSAKEAVYKALWPTLRRFLDFQALAVAWDDADGSFRATAHDPGCPAPLAEAIRGRCLRQAGMLVTAAWISAGDWRPGPGPAPA